MTSSKVLTENILDKENTKSVENTNNKNDNNNKNNINNNNNKNNENNKPEQIQKNQTTDAETTSKLTDPSSSVTNLPNGGRSEIKKVSEGGEEKGKSRWRMRLNYATKSIVEQARQAGELGECRANQRMLVTNTAVVTVTPMTKSHPNQSQHSGGSGGGSSGPADKSGSTNGNDKNNHKNKLSKSDSSSTISSIIQTAKDVDRVNDADQSYGGPESLLLISQLRRQINTLANESALRGQQCTALRAKMEDNQKQFEEDMQKKKEHVEETELKLKALEEHFQALNEVMEEHRSENDLKNASLSNNNNNNNLNHERQLGNGVKSDKSSIVQLDSAYVADLHKNLAEGKDKIERLENELSSVKRTSKKKQTNLQMVNEDLVARLECREMTISTLEQSMAQLKESRYKRKSKNRRRSTLQISSPTNPGVGYEDDSSINSGASFPIIKSVENGDRVSGPSLKSNVVSIAVQEALKKKEEEHILAMNQLRENMVAKLEAQDATIEDLENKLDAAVKHNLQRSSLCIKDGNGNPSQTFQCQSSFSMRSITMANELLQESTRKLTNLLNRLEEGQIQDSSKQGTEEAKRAEIHHLAHKLSMIQEELHISMRLVEQRIRNDIDSTIQSIDETSSSKQTSNPRSNNKDETGQASGEAIAHHHHPSTSKYSSSPKTSHIEKDIIINKEEAKEVVSRAQNDMLKQLRDAETSILEKIEDLKDRIRDFEYEEF